VRLTIGCFAENNWLKNENVSRAFQGVSEACEQYDVNLIRFGYLNANELLNVGSQHSVILDLIERFNLDGLIFTGWMHGVQGDNLSELRKKVKVPLFSIGKIIDDIPSNYMDGGYYLRQLIVHLVKVHQHKRIAYICPWSYDGRNDVYIETLTKQGLYDPELYVSETTLIGLNMYERIQMALHLLLDERNVEFDAIMAMTMEEAYTVQKILLKRGYRVPQDIAVCSYEDGEILKYASPSITSIYFPTKEIGFSGTEKLIEMIRTGNVDEITIVPGGIEYRESCGCRTKRTLSKFEAELRELGKQKEERDLHFRQSEEIHQMLAATYSRAEFFEVLSLGLSRLDVRDCYMFEYSHLSREFDDCALTFHYTDSKHNPLESNDSFRAVKHRIIPESRRVTYIAELLHIADDHYGFILIETANLDIRIYLSLTSNLSATLKGIHLIDNLEKEIRLRRENQEHLIHVAHFDQLTNLYNRRSFHNELISLCKNMKSFTLMFVDIDGFKQVNDTYGHDIGDLVLIEIACRLHQMLSRIVITLINLEESIVSREAIFRLGGDEFTAIIDSTDHHVLKRIAINMIDSLQQPILINGESILIGASIGFSKFPEDTKDYETLIKYADRAMYKAKGIKNTYAIFDQQKLRGATSPGIKTDVGI
jgi:diguanylate cyclase (GGDEF)-like protein